jgi:cytidylate kinase
MVISGYTSRLRQALAVERTLSPQSDRTVAALALLSRYAESHSVTKESPPVSIAITRQAGSRGAEIADAIGARLGWPVYDHKLLSRIAKEEGLSARLLEQLDERCASWLVDVAAGFSARSRVSEGTYMKHLMELLVSLGQIGHCVIVGRGAAHVLPLETTVRVRVVAPRVLRVAQTEQRKGISRTEAENWVDQTDTDRVGFVKNHFNRDPNDPLNYDLILNSGRYTTDECARLIVEATRIREAQVKTAPVVPLTV